MTSYTLNLDMLREGVTYDFRVIAVNDYGYGSPSAPSPSISGMLVYGIYVIVLCIYTAGQMLELTLVLTLLVLISF